MLPFLDTGRMSVLGTRYGGFVAGMALADRQQALFKCGVVVAPITDWRYYGECIYGDCIYITLHCTVTVSTIYSLKDRRGAAAICWDSMITTIML